MDYYNKSPVLIALLGVLLTCLRGVMGTPINKRATIYQSLVSSQQRAQSHMGELVLEEVQHGLES
ncbi:hypothetical protein PHMEG_0004855 [Phytophthora megakarya]|uniref:Uncharacterized protein n=1 Tax=Phytophthora megakarya TaxID=4795 RepID=A0A225WSV6_9STRA|nr:hypothetical protein PHMEG_0004855 [Phytophthora megakarya]